jgi:hypothetical protein
LILGSPLHSVHARLLDSTGRVVRDLGRSGRLTAGLHQFHVIDLDRTLARGIYYLVVNVGDSGARVSRKVVLS